MSKQRLLLWLLGALIALVVVGGLLQVVRNLIWDLSYLLPTWLVGPVLLLTAALILAVAIHWGWPWWQKIKHRKANPREGEQQPAELPRSRRQAAQQSLESIDHLLDRLEDDVSREGLRQQRQRVAEELARGDLVVVVFGTGSSGKTSLIRALLNDIVGEVGAAMGSTTRSQTYRLRLKALNRGLRLVDTPGILEAGQEGRNREEEARQRASRADLMLVVVDSDLRAAELALISNLTDLGKRLLLVLNKCDLRGEDEVSRLLQLLRSRCSSILEPEDVVACSAAPQSIPRPGQRPLQPQPEVNSLLRRLAAVLHADGEELLADNILMQCRNLGDAGRRLLDDQRQQEARQCVDRYSWISGGVVAASPLPGVDLLGSAAVNAQMVIEVARIYGVQLTKDRAQDLAITVGRSLAGLGVVKGGVTLIGAALTINLPTLLLGRAVQGVAAAWLTRIAGASFITYFQQDQDWGDGGIQEVVQKHYKLNKRESSLKRFLEMALRQVVEPLQRQRHRQLPPRPGPREEVEEEDREHQER